VRAEPKTLRRVWTDTTSLRAVVQISITASARGCKPQIHISSAYDFSPLKLMEALFRKSSGGTSMTAQEMTIRHDPQTPPADSTTKRIFIGPNGLRAGWRLLIFMAIVKAMSTVAQMIISASSRPRWIRRK
jgi:hypothetical protein